VYFTTTSEASEIEHPSAVETVNTGLVFSSILPSQHSLAWQIDAILTTTDSSLGMGAVKRIFNDLVRLLECLRLMEANLHQIRETVALLELIRLDTIALLDFTENEALQIKDLKEDLFEVLDGMSFALRHEVKRVFEESEQPSSDEAPEIIHAKLGDAHRVLTNCLQQSIITLAQVFDPRLDGRQLFNNSKARLKQSLMLCKDLWTLTNACRRAERAWDEDSVSLVIQRVNAFRSSSMHYLMYKDWGHFERLAKELDSSVNEQLECGPILHKLLTYLETLLGQVKNRAVLAELMPDVLSNQLDGHDSELEWSSDEVRLAFELYMAG
jgi:hypothetical protein